MSEPEYLDVAGCAALLGVSNHRVRRLVRNGEFPPPAGADGASYWLDSDVMRWAARQGPPLSARVPLRYWPDANASAEFLGATRVPNRYCRDDIVLSWAAEVGSVAIIWRPDDPIMLTLTDFVSDVGTDVLVTVDPDFGLDGPALRAINRAHPEKQSDLAWSDLARVLGQPMPYWPYTLRDPDLIESWTPDSVTVEAPARPELNTAPLLQMAGMFEPSHPTHRTLLNLVRVAQERGTRDARDDLRILAETTETAPELRVPTVVVAAEPLVIGNLDADGDDVDATTRRIGWLELLGRSDTLSWQCVQEIAAWDGGSNFPFSGLEDVDQDTAHGREWASRLEPLDKRSAAFAVLGSETTGDLLVDPITEAPAVRRADGTIRTVTAQRLPTSSRLSEVVIARPIWIRTDDGTLYLAPREASSGLSWGYSGSGPVTLAQLIDRLLDDITTDPSTLRHDPPEGLKLLTAMKWPTGTVLNRDVLEAARDSRAWSHPDRPE